MRGCACCGHAVRNAARGQSAKAHCSTQVRCVSRRADEHAFEDVFTLAERSVEVAQCSVALVVSTGVVEIACVSSAACLLTFFRSRQFFSFFRLSGAATRQPSALSRDAQRQQRWRQRMTEQPPCRVKVLEEVDTRVARWRYWLLECRLHQRPAPADAELGRRPAPAR